MQVPTVEQALIHAVAATLEPTVVLGLACAAIAALARFLEQVLTCVARVALARFLDQQRVLAASAPPGSITMSRNNPRAKSAMQAPSALLTVPRAVPCADPEHLLPAQVSACAQIA